MVFTLFSCSTVNFVCRYLLFHVVKDWVTLSICPKNSIFIPKSSYWTECAWLWEDVCLSKSSLEELQLVPKMIWRRWPRVHMLRYGLQWDSFFPLWFSLSLTWLVFLYDAISSALFQKTLHKQTSWCCLEMLMTQTFYFSLTTAVHALGFNYCPTSAHRNIHVAVACNWIQLHVEIELNSILK